MIKLVFVLLVLATVGLALYEPCNPKNSLAAQINWAGNPECK